MKALAWTAWLLIQVVSNGETLEEGLQRHIEEAIRHPSRENLISLANEIKDNRRHQGRLSQKALELTDLAASELCKIPGHARYFAEEIKREQEEVKQYATNSGPRVSYDRHRTWHFETLRNLPSPETIWVLGEFLSDDVDTPHSSVPEDSDWGEIDRANSFFSSMTISEIGLRDAPAGRELFDIRPEQHLATTRAWWAEIESGKRTFSFKGQNVEYRFKPDGTWETLTMANPPDDGPGRPESGPNRPERKSSPPPVNIKTETTEWSRPWLLVAAGILTVLATIALRMLRTRQ